MIPRLLCLWMKSYKQLGRRRCMPTMAMLKLAAPLKSMPDSKGDAHMLGSACLEAVRLPPLQTSSMLVLGILHMLSCFRRSILDMQAPISNGPHCRLRANPEPQKIEFSSPLMAMDVRPLPTAAMLCANTRSGRQEAARHRAEHGLLQPTACDVR